MLCLQKHRFPGEWVIHSFAGCFFPVCCDKRIFFFFWKKERKLKGKKKKKKKNSICEMNLSLTVLSHLKGRVVDMKD